MVRQSDFDDLLRLAEEGDHRNVDMLVSDIYGGAYQKLGLPSDLIASSFGKTVRHGRDTGCSFVSSPLSVSFRHSPRPALQVTLPKWIFQIGRTRSRRRTRRAVFC